MSKYLDFVCTKEMFCGRRDSAVSEFDAYENYDVITEFYDSTPECQSFPKEEYFSGNWYDNWVDYVIWEDGRIAARAGVWKLDGKEWEVTGVITRPEYRGKGYSARLVAHCIAVIVEQGKTAILSTAETNVSMIAAAQKAGFTVREK